MKINCIYCGKEFEYDESIGSVLSMAIRGDSKSFAHLTQYIGSLCCSGECKSNAVSEWFREIFNGNIVDINIK